MYLFGIVWIFISIFIGVFINILTRYKKKHKDKLDIKDIFITILTIYLIYIVINNFFFIFDQLGINYKHSYSTLVISSIIIMALNHKVFKENLQLISNYIIYYIIPSRHNLVRYIFASIMIVFNILYIFYFKNI